MSAIDFTAKITKAELSTSSPTSARIELQRCNAGGIVESAPFAALALDIPVHRLGEFVPGSLVSVSIHPLKAQVK